MELSPSLVHASIGSTVEFTCKYFNTAVLDIVAFENGIPVYGKTVKYVRCGKYLARTWRTEVSNKPTIVQCMLRNKQMLSVGLLTAHIYPGLQMFLVKQCASAVF